MGLKVEVDLPDARHAVSLLGRLHCYHAHIVQVARHDDPWLVRVCVPGLSGEGLTDLIDEIVEWHDHAHDIGVSLVPERSLADDLRPSQRRRRAGV